MVEYDSLNTTKSTQSWIFLGILALAATVYELFNILPLFNAFFIRDDFLFLDMGPVMRQNPLIFLTATCIGWWRPIALLFPALFYLIFGFSPLPFHILAFFIHLASGVMLLLFTRRLFNTKVALVAYSLYITAPIAVSNVGWILGAVEDETATFFFFCALFSQLRLGATGQSSKKYWLPAVFLVLASFCKITWLGLFPALLFVDGVNYPAARFWQRLKRLSPFILVIPTLLLNFLIIGFGELGGAFLPNFSFYFTPVNLIWGATLPFLPTDLFGGTDHKFYLRLVAPLLFFLLPLVTFKSYRRKIILLGLAFIGLLVILGLAALYNQPVGWIMGWRHITPLVGFASILIAVTLLGIIEKLKIKNKGLLGIIAVIALWNWAGYSQKQILAEEVNSDQRNYRTSISSLLNLVDSFPEGSEIYIIGKKVLSINLMRDLIWSDRELILLVIHSGYVDLVHNYNANSKFIIIKDADQIDRYLGERVKNPSVKVISIDNDGYWWDVTASYYQVSMK